MGREEARRDRRGDAKVVDDPVEALDENETGAREIPKAVR
jgi:hypothetical protein